MCPLTSTTDTARWYGEQAQWVLPFQGLARRRYGDRLHARCGPGRLTYHLEGLRVRARKDLVPVTVHLYARPRYDTFGLPPQDYPRVFADAGASSPHRMPEDDALCLYYPLDPVEQRWHAGLGLLTLLEIVADHLFSEDFWRRSGGTRRGVWPGQEAPHGFPRAVP